MKLKVKIIPSSDTNSIIGWLGEFLKIKIKEAPTKGKANAELITFLSQELGIQIGKYPNNSRVYN